MEIQGWFYLHDNRELIYKNYPDAIQDIRESDLCKAAWAFDNTRQTAWRILVEALTAGAKRERIFELAKKWNCTDDDAIDYADSIGVQLGNDGNQRTATKIDFVNLQEFPCGFGDTYLEAMSELCGELEYKADKLGWGATFADLVKT